MSIVRYHHWPRQAARQQQIDNLFHRFFDQGAANATQDQVHPDQQRWSPRVDVIEEAARFVILADLPGVQPDQIDIQMDKGVLTIQGTRAAAEAVGEKGRYSRTERQQGSFHRSFNLPDSADADGIVASGNQGVLEISIPKKAQSTPRKIQVGNSGAATPSVQ